MKWSKPWHRTPSCLISIWSAYLLTVFWNNTLHKIMMSLHRETKGRFRLHLTLMQEWSLFWKLHQNMRLFSHITEFSKLALSRNNMRFLLSNCVQWKNIIFKHKISVQFLRCSNCNAYLFQNMSELYHQQVMKYIFTYKTFASLSFRGLLALD